MNNKILPGIIHRLSQKDLKDVHLLEEVALLNVGGCKYLRTVRCSSRGADLACRHAALISCAGMYCRKSTLDYFMHYGDRCGDN